MSYLCSTCYAVNKKARNILEVDEYRAQTNAVLAKVGRRYDDRVAGAVAAQARARDPLGGAREHPRARAPPPRRHQGRDPPGLSLLQGLPRRDHGRQRELHGPGGAADARRRRPDRQLQREDDALRRRLPPALREPVDLGRRDPREAAPAGPGAGRRLRPHVPQLPRAVRPLPRHHLGERRTRSTRSCTCTCSSSWRWRWAPTPRRCSASRRIPRTSSPSSSASAPRRRPRREGHDEGRGCAMRTGVFLCQCGGNITGVVDLGTARRPRPHPRRRRRGRDQPVHVRHRGP